MSSNDGNALRIHGLHHITAIAGDAQENLDFYTGTLGLRLVKKTVNFDAPDTYHLYYGDHAGRPGSILTFFPFAGAMPGRGGPGIATATAFSVPAGSLDGWMERFADRAYDFDAPEERFGEPVLRLEDPDGLPLELVAHDAADGGEGAASSNAAPEEAPAPELAIRSFHSATLCLEAPERTARLLTDVFGYEEAGAETERLRFRAPGGGRASVIDLRTQPSRQRGRGGSGTVHHIAFRASDEEEQQAWRRKLLEAGLNVTPVKDRQYFKSIYFREPGGVLFEIATDPPGFHIDETDEALGKALKLPEWLEPRRERIEASLPRLRQPAPARG